LAPTRTTTARKPAAKAAAAAKPAATKAVKKAAPVKVARTGASAVKGKTSSSVR
jgi:hypothetical protein